MGREETRFRERVVARRMKRLRHTPSEQELQKEIDRLHEAQGHTAQRDRALRRRDHTPRTLG